MDFKSTGILPSGYAVTYGILKNRHLVELSKKRPKNRKNTEQTILVDILTEIVYNIGETTKVTKEVINSLTPIDFKQLMCLIRQNTHDYPESIEQPLSYNEVDEFGNKTGHFVEFSVKEKIIDGEFQFEIGQIAFNNGYKDKNNTVLKPYEKMDRTYQVTIPASKRREAIVIKMTAPTLKQYTSIEDGDVVKIIDQRKPQIKKGKGWVRLRTGDLPMNTANIIMKAVEKNEGAVHTQTQYEHPQTGDLQVIDFTDYPEFLLGK